MVYGRGGFPASAALGDYFVTQFTGWISQSKGGPTRDSALYECTHGDMGWAIGRCFSNALSISECSNYTVETATDGPAWNLSRKRLDVSTGAIYMGGLLRGSDPEN